MAGSIGFPTRSSQGAAVSSVGAPFHQTVFEQFFHNAPEVTRQAVTKWQNPPSYWERLQNDPNDVLPSPAQIRDIIAKKEAALAKPARWFALPEDAQISDVTTAKTLFATTLSAAASGAVAGSFLASVTTAVVPDFFYGMIGVVTGAVCSELSAKFLRSFQTSPQMEPTPTVLADAFGTLFAGATAAFVAGNAAGWAPGEPHLFGIAALGMGAGFFAGWVLKTALLAGADVLKNRTRLLAKRRDERKVLEDNIRADINIVALRATPERLFAADQAALERFFKGEILTRYESAKARFLKEESYIAEQKTLMNELLGDQKNDGQGAGSFSLFAMAVEEIARYFIHGQFPGITLEDNPNNLTLLVQALREEIDALKSQREILATLRASSIDPRQIRPVETAFARQVADIVRRLEHTLSRCADAEERLIDVREEYAKDIGA